MLRAILPVLCGAAMLHAHTVDARPGFFDINLYPVFTDVKADSVATVNVFSSLSDRWHYASLTNIIREEETDSFSTGYKYYTEQNFRWKVSEDSAFDLTTQLNFRSGSQNDRYRFGVRCRLDDTAPFQALFDKWKLSYSINLHALQIDEEPGDVWQVEHVFRKSFSGRLERLYLAGFIDHTFDQELPALQEPSYIVAEAQLGWKLQESLYLVTEYRVNEYRIGREWNLSGGIQYLVRW
ncbi:hypothetical protein [Pelagicoccus albus]|uniref:DUF2490 domain-containing protein n=1 Tax=Pelagicoccus albus TaxID=415222 RepID=A0A7X1B370_9BACT|nr:hypothetical protein [Pelagicoccus albus]MBC2604554.1 hypothetical protein [Pelagicoccus albus]